VKNKATVSVEKELLESFLDKMLILYNACKEETFSIPFIKFIKFNYGLFKELLKDLKNYYIKQFDYKNNTKESNEYLGKCVLASFLSDLIAKGNEIVIKTEDKEIQLNHKTYNEKIVYSIRCKYET